MKKIVNPITVVFMGDSITEGQYVHHSLRWTERLVRYIRTQVESQEIDCDALHFFNRGISGETTRQGLERFPRDVQVLQPDVMTLQFGLNDCNCWDTDRGLPRVSEAAYRANLIEMIDRARAFGARQIILSTNHPTLRFRILASRRSLEEHRMRYNEIVREVAVETKVSLCDMELVFSDVKKDELVKLLLPEPDVLHLSEAGHQKYFGGINDMVLAAINEILMEKNNV